MAYTFLIGLGNPGPEYRDTRHNIGERVLRCLRGKHPGLWHDFKILRGVSSKYSIALPRGKKNSEWALVRSNTYMNDSGAIVRELFGCYGDRAGEILVLCDDVNLALGELRFRRGGSSGGQKGLESVSNEMKTGEFARLRIGIGQAQRPADLADFVLSPFDRDEASPVKSLVEKAAEAALVYLKEGLTGAMNRFNARLENKQTEENT